ncbi:allantoate deiminase [Cohnella sp. CFH 77786]|uniref:allantoate deiminase n=1 Tax=Cohnella sp. CFH 77786 TaxID=2662265 RepID=UPI001C60B264|nr:allantoate deiminase [Cohnella sp. CFH 77786]MBW5448526.1 allantoate deiminase [Cohnella sp. CFH 77786]
MNAETDRASYVTRLLEDLGSIGVERGGGITRLLYSESWRQAQAFLADVMAEAGLEVRFDRVGNLFGRLEGTSPDAPVILTGSHVDTVRSGGKYDGAYGIAASLSAVLSLKERYGKPKRSLEVVSFCEEEGSRFPLAYWGSGSVSGILSPELADTAEDPDGVLLGDAMKEAGFGREDQPDPRRRDIGAFLEVHVEQGVILERTGERVGIVETIAGQRRYILTVEGEANHAGTTPMSMRQDALAAAAEMIQMLEKAAVRAGEPLVATVGRMKIAPNIPNVIPGTVEFTLDIRHLSETLLTGFCEAVLGKCRSIAVRRGLALRVQTALQSRPVPMDPLLTGRLERICRERGLAYRRMMSGAGHDAQSFSSLCPTAMLFVPSRAGISHSPEEYTAPEHLETGLDILTEMLHELAYEDPL